MLSVNAVKASIRFNFCESHKDIKAYQSLRFTSPLFWRAILSALALSTLSFSGASIAQVGETNSLAKKIFSIKKINIVISASSAIAVDRFYGKALGLTRLPDVNIENAYPVMRYQLKNNDVISELHFVIAREKLPRLKGGAGVARGFRLLSLSLPQAEKTAVLRRLHISGRNPILEARTSASGKAYELGSIFDADGNQINIHFVSDKHFAMGSGLFELGLFVENKKATEKSLSKLFCDTEAVKNCWGEYFLIQVFRAKKGLNVWSGLPDKRVGFSFVQIEDDDVSKKHQAFVKKKADISVSGLNSVSVTGVKSTHSFVLRLESGLLVEMIEP